MLRISDDKDIFRIIQFTDLHFGDLPWDHNDLRTKELMIKKVEELKPDLAVFTGDNIWTDGVVHYERCYEDFIELVNSLNIPIAITYGNHDSEDKMSREKLEEMGKKYFQHVQKINRVVIDRRENYYFPILNKKSKEILRIIMIDSWDYDANGICLYAPLLKEQGEYVSLVSKESQGALCFMHMPFPEYWMGVEKHEGDLKETHAMISSCTYQYGFFTEVLLNGNVKGIFCGHDHNNNFTFNLNGIQLGYGNVSGFNCYGDLLRGVRVFDINEDGGYKTYISTYK